MAKRSDSRLLAGLIIVVVGAGILIYGLIAYRDAQASLGNAIGKLFTGSSKEENRAVVISIAGGVLAILGLVIAFIKSKR